jgi:hypothetical protein
MHDHAYAAGAAEALAAWQKDDKIKATVAELQLAAAEALLHIGEAMRLLHDHLMNSGPASGDGWAQTMLAELSGWTLALQGLCQPMTHSAAPALIGKINAACKLNLHTLQDIIDHFSPILPRVIMGAAVVVAALAVMTAMSNLKQAASYCKGRDQQLCLIESLINRTSVSAEQTTKELAVLLKADLLHLDTNEVLTKLSKVRFIKEDVQNILARMPAVQSLATDAKPLKDAAQSRAARYAAAALTFAAALCPQVRLVSTTVRVAGYVMAGGCGVAAGVHMRIDASTSHSTSIICFDRARVLRKHGVRGHDLPSPTCPKRPERPREKREQAARGRPRL